MDSCRQIDPAVPPQDRGMEAKQIEIFRSRVNLHLQTGYLCKVLPTFGQKAIVVRTARNKFRIHGGARWMASRAANKIAGGSSERSSLADLLGQVESFFEQIRGPRKSVGFADRLLELTCIIPVDRIV
jgi:hypothetical protein